MKPGRVLYIGNFGPAHSTETHVARSFAALGWNVVKVQEDRLIESPDMQALVSATVAGGGVDLVAHTRTWGLPEAWACELWRDCAGERIPTMAYHLDRYFGLEASRREDVVATDPMFRMAYVFTADGDHQGDFERYGVHHRWLRPGVVADECYDAEPSRKWRHTRVAFVGSAPTRRGGNYHHEWTHRAELVEHLEAWYGDAFAHVGNGGGFDTLRGAPLNEFYASVPVIVGDSCLYNPPGGDAAAAHYWSDRIPETWGRGGFLIHPHVQAAADEIGVFPSWPLGDWTELRATIDRYLERPDIRDEKRMQLAGVVRSRCTYTHRVAEALAYIAWREAGGTGEPAYAAVTA